MRVRGIQWFAAFALWFMGSLLIHGAWHKAAFSTALFALFIGGLRLAMRTPPGDRHIKP